MALLMAVYHFLLLITLYLIKPVRDSLFLAERGAAELPYVFILTTVFVVPVAMLHTRLGRTLRVGRLVDGVTLFLAANLIGLQWLVTTDVMWAEYVLYAWVSIYSLLVTSQFWLMANAIFQASQAKRVFTVLSVGAILGAVAGGEVTGLLVNQLGMSSHSLLVVAAVVLAGTVGLAQWIRFRHRQRTGAIEDGDAYDVEDAEDVEGVEAPGDETPGDETAGDETAVDVETAETEEARTRFSPDAGGAGAWTLIRNSRHLLPIVGVIAATVITSTFVDFQFKTVAAAAYPTEDALTSFMGRFYGRVSLVALIVQFFIAPRLIRVLGVGGALSVLPAALAAGAAGMLLVPGLMAGIALRGADQSLKHSIDKTGRELLFVPVSLEKKKRVKVFVDLFVDQGAQGVAGGLLLALTAGLGFGVQQLSGVVLLLLATWGYLAYRARLSYVDEFRRKLRQQEDYDTTGSDEPVSRDLDEILKSLCSRSETETLSALDQLETGDYTPPVKALLCLLDHPSAAVRAKAIDVLRVRTVEGVAEEVAEALTDPDPDVQVAAARYLYCQSGDRIARLKEGLSHDDVRIQAAAVGLVAQEGDDETYRLVIENHLRRLMEVPGDEGEDARTHVARLLGAVDRPYRVDMLSSLLQDASHQVVRAAIDAAGRSGERAFVYPLLKYLGDPDLQDDARDALATYGKRILGTLYDVLVDDTVGLDVRRRVPAILRDFDDQLAVTALVWSLDKVPVPVRHAAVKALGRMHADGSYQFDETTVENRLREEARYYAALGQVIQLFHRSHHDRIGRLNREAAHVLREESLERIFRMLGLRFNQRDIYDAYHGITSDEPALRSSAVEFVDNLVDYATSRYLLPLLDDPNGHQAKEHGRRHLDLLLRTPDDARKHFKNVNDPRIHRLLNEEPVDLRTGDGLPEPEVTPDVKVES